MASIEKRSGPQGIGYLVSIRRRGHPPIYETFDSLAEARAFAARTEANIADKKHYGMARVRTVADLLDAYQPEAKPIKTAATRARVLAWWREHYGNVKLRDFDASMLVKAKRKLTTEGVKRHALQDDGKRAPRAAATVKHYLIYMGQALKFGVAVLKWMDRNPMADVEKPKIDNARIRWLTDEERARLLDACQRSENPDIYLIVLLALSSGARQGEIRNLRWSQIDFANSVAWLTPADTKTKAARAMPLVGAALELLRERSKVRRIDTDLVFASPEGGDRARNLRNAFAVAVKRAGITGLRFHDLRHSAATSMLRAGVDSRVVAAVLGHRTLAMMQRYQHVAPDFVVEAALKAAIKSGL